jgi:hypothetical protein
LKNLFQEINREINCEIEIFLEIRGVVVLAYMNQDETATRLATTGKLILKTPGICGGRTYSLKGECVGSEILDIHTRTTRIFEPVEVEQHIRHGLEHPVFLWNSVTLIGAYNERDMNEFVRTLTEKHVKHSFSIFQEKGSMAKTVTLVLDSPGHRFLSTPQAYVNGVRFGVLTKGDLICVEKVHPFVY